MLPLVTPSPEEAPAGLRFSTAELRTLWSVPNLIPSSKSRGAQKMEILRVRCAHLWGEGHRTASIVHWNITKMSYLVIYVIHPQHTEAWRPRRLLEAAQDHN